jgi:CDP-diacylglycerol---glycerol-3-phosphate 3-phosphatidyltransferase
MNPPNLLTLLRLACIPVLVGIFYLPSLYRFHLSALVFLLASTTDLLDGYLARRNAQITTLGKLLDPVADKLLITAALLLLVEAGRLWAWVALLVIGREIAVTGLRAVASSSGAILPAEGIGKFKMFFQVISITILFLADPVAEPFFWLLGVVSLGTAVILGLVSGGQYALRVGHLFGLPKIEP